MSSVSSEGVFASAEGPRVRVWLGAQNAYTIAAELKACYARWLLNISTSVAVVYHVCCPRGLMQTMCTTAVSRGVSSFMNQGASDELLLTSYLLVGLLATRWKTLKRIRFPPNTLSSIGELSSLR